MGFRIIKGQLIRKQRGERSLDAIVQASGGRFSKASLSQWENESYKPNDEKVPVLLMALGCSFEDISEPVELVAA